eukprot:7833450-Alexandrium_andersonii.AAC.1
MSDSLPPSQARIRLYSLATGDEACAARSDRVLKTLDEWAERIVLKALRDDAFPSPVFARLKIALQYASDWVFSPSVKYCRNSPSMRHAWALLNCVRAVHFMQRWRHIRPVRHASSAFPQDTID